MFRGRQIYHITRVEQAQQKADCILGPQETFIFVFYSSSDKANEYISIICRAHTCYFWILHLTFALSSQWKSKQPLNNGDVSTILQQVVRTKFLRVQEWNTSLRFYLRKVNVCTDAVFFWQAQETFPFVFLSKNVGFFFCSLFSDWWLTAMLGGGTSANRALGWRHKIFIGNCNNCTLKEQPRRIVTFETFDQSDEKTWPDQRKGKCNEI